MAALARLIQGQDIAFDTHQAGDRQSVRLRDLHLEKRLHAGGKIRYPMFGDGRPTASTSVNETTSARVIREVSRSLRKNPRRTNQLARVIADVLSRFSNGTATIEVAREAARNIAGHFGLSQEFEESVVTFFGDRLVKFSSRHSSRDLGEAKRLEISARRVVIRRIKRSRLSSPPG